MGDITAKANAAVGDLKKTLGKFDKQIQANTGTFAAALNTAASSRDLINKLQAAGIYTLILAPEKGSWVTRMLQAADAPHGGGYCCGTVSISIVPDLDSAMSALDKMKSALEKPISGTADSMKATMDDIGDEFTPEEEPEDFELIDTSAFKGKTLDDLFTPNSWHSATMGDVFGGALQVTADGLNTAVTAGQALLKQRNVMSATKAMVNKGMNTVNGVLNGMAATGVYNIMLEPGLGNYLSRLQKEIGAPSQNPDLYCTGIATIAIAPSLTDLVSKFDTMSKLIKGI
jgi:hypothetical protein